MSIKRAVKHITWDKSNPSLFQSRNCFKKMLEIEPGKEKMVKGSDSFHFVSEVSLENHFCV